MVDIQSKEVIDKISDELKIQPALQIPRELAKDIQLSYNVNPVRKLFVRTFKAADSVSGTIFTADTRKRTFLVGVALSVTKSALATSVLSEINAIMEGDGTRRNLLEIAYEPLGAGQFVTSLILPIPIEIAKGTAVNVDNSTNIASIDALGIAYFYETDPQ